MSRLAALSTLVSCLTTLSSGLRVAPVIMSAASPQHQSQKRAVSRQHVIQTTLLGLSGAVGVVQSASAYQGIYGMEIVTAKDAVLDETALSDATVKKAVSDFRSLKKTVKDLQASVVGDAQYDLAPVLRKEFDPVKVRDTFNNLNALFDKDTQYGTDRLQRGILQDLVEIETNSKLAPGKPRSAKKLALVLEKLKKLDTTFDKLDEYLAQGV